MIKMMKYVLAASVVLAASNSAFADEQSCQDLKEALEKQLAAEGKDDVSLEVMSVNAKAADKILAKCAEGQRQVVLIDRDPS